MVRLVFATGLGMISLIIGCSAPSDSPKAPAEKSDTGSDTGTFGSARTPAAWASRGFSEVTLVERGEGIVIENVAYFSDGLRIAGQVCRPDDARAHPVVLRNHGGFTGLQADAADTVCRALAATGYVVASSSYRGEDGSDGHVEACLGEVDDVEAMLDALAVQPYVQPERVAALGASHGGCITLELALRRPTLRAAVDFYGFGDMTSLYGFWQRQLALGEPPPCPVGAAAACQAAHAGLVELVTGLAGGPPSAGGAYVERSPATRLGGLRVPLMILHGAGDYVVDLAQACAKRAALAAAGQKVDAYYVDADLLLANPDACGGGFLVAPSTAPTQLLLFEGQGHGFSGAASAYAWSAALSFILIRL